MSKKVYTKKELSSMTIKEIESLPIFKKLKLRTKQRKATTIEAILDSQKVESKPKAKNKPIAVKAKKEEKVLTKAKVEDKQKSELDKAVENTKRAKQVVENKQEKSKSKENIFKRFRLKISNITFR
jgi:hypothetical protein